MSETQSTLDQPKPKPVRVADDLGVSIRLYQADDASDAPGAWYASQVVNGKACLDLRLTPDDAAAIQLLASRLLAGAKPIGG